MIVKYKLVTIDTEGRASVLAVECESDYDITPYHYWVPFGNTMMIEHDNNRENLAIQKLREYINFMGYVNDPDGIIPINDN